MCARFRRLSTGIFAQSFRKTVKLRPSARILPFAPILLPLKIGRDLRRPILRVRFDLRFHFIEIVPIGLALLFFKIK